VHVRTRANSQSDCPEVRGCVDPLGSALRQRRSTLALTATRATRRRSDHLAAACFGLAQRQAVREAGQVAELNLARVRCAVLAAKGYLKSNRNLAEEDELVLVFELGSGSLSIALAQISAQWGVRAIAVGVNPDCDPNTRV
jgi:Hsp70 protein